MNGKGSVRRREDTAAVRERWPLPTPGHAERASKAILSDGAPCDCAACGTLPFVPAGAS